MVVCPAFCRLVQNNQKIMRNHQREEILLNFQKIDEKLTSAAIASQISEVTKLNKERSHLLPLVTSIQQQNKYQAELDDIQLQIKKETDAELLSFLKEEENTLSQKIENLESEILIMLLPKDENAGKNIFLEIRAGTGGEEASMFVKDLFRMYVRFMENQQIDFEIVNLQHAGQNRIKECILLAKGEEVYDLFHLEGGGHRVQRIPETESSGRIHTSACTVAVIPEVEENELQINPNEIRIDVYRSSGPGGQSVNTTDSAVRITHIPTEIVVSCQDEKSQRKNKAKAMSILRARIKDREITEQRKKQVAEKKAQVGSGDRSEKIRTYNFPQNRLTDHRINYTSHNLNQVMDGDLSSIIKQLLQHERETKLANINEEKL